MPTQIISSGSSLSGGTISSGASYEFQSGASMVGVTIASGGSATIDAGATDSGSTIASGAFEIVSGQATGDAIYGTQLVSLGGAIVQSETVYAGGSLDLFIKGTESLDTTISSGGTLAINGNAVASNTTLSAGAVLNLESPKATLEGSLVFAGAATLEITDTTSAGFGDLATISGFGSGAAIDIAVLGTGATLSTSFADDVTTATVISGGVSEIFLFSGNVSGLGLVADGTGGVDLVFGSGGTAIAASGSTVTVSAGTTSGGAVITDGVTYVVDATGVLSNALISSGGSAIISGSDENSTILAGGYELVSGQATGDTIFGVQELSAGTATATSETVANGGALELFLKGASATDITIASGGTLAISGNATAEDTTVSAGGVIDLQSPKAVLAGTVTFVDGGTLKIDDIASAGFGDLATIDGFGSNSVIDISVIGSGAVLTTSVSGDLTTATVTSDSVSQSFVFSGAIASDFAITNDQAGGVEITYAPCFAAGTRITTTEGPIAIEELTVGEELVTVDRGTLEIVWIGYRTVDCASHPAPESVLPVRVLAHAFGPDRPRRDLLLSPDHAIFAEGVLIPVKHLINGRTIRQESVAEITYYHVELTEHAVILAEGLPAESYLEGTDRSSFSNGGGTARLHPSWGRSELDGSLIWDAVAAAPLCVTGPALDRVRADLAEQVAVLNHPSAHQAAIRRAG
ncbi:MAG TPA: Hint domain-containing protein [Acidisoma sp.]|nr:Hint domain-containing protein [Acidisoma sp.]